MMTRRVLLLLCWLTTLGSGIPSSTLPNISPAQQKIGPSQTHQQGPAPRNPPPSYEIVTPIRVTEDGRFLTHDLTHTYNYERRRKREATMGGIDPTIHYSLHIEGKEHLVELEPNHGFLAPHAVVERRSKYNSSTDDATARIGAVVSQMSVIGTDSHCHLVGRVSNHVNSNVALSACDGLRGYLKTDFGEFLIEPLERRNRTRDQPHLHKVYRRSLPSTQTPPNEGGECATKRFREAVEARELWERREGLGGDSNPGRRVRRSVSVERNVEALVVADKKMIDFYSDEDINTYILTIMNMVSSIFHDASIGNAVNILVVRILLLETPEYEEELEISEHADTTLLSFCKWQEMVNPASEEHPHHHDVALLLTRYNICSQSGSHCSTLGLAEIAGMCQPNRSCNVNEDTGLQIAYTIAHEIGHNFGMDHDSLGNGCGDVYGVSQHVMSPHLATDAIPMTWSNCSRHEITNFLDRDWGRCLVDEPPAVEYNFPRLPPGAMYDADHQCRLAFGAKAWHCKAEAMQCHTLWCRVNNRCVTRLEPAADGTQCGKHMWCYYGNCVTMGERPEAIHGSWGPWSPWSTCSRSCGAGVKIASRQCNNPPPANGGKYCVGGRKKYRICNTEDCPNNGISFRAVQCSAFDKQPYKGNNHTWGPVTLESSPCQLHCKPDNEFYAVELRDTVEDGTPCKPGTRDMCIHGICKRVACDWTIEGSAQEDRCGLCHGDGTQCVTKSGVFNLTTGISYVPMVTFPTGAKTARVEEMGAAPNYLAVRDDDTGEFYLNGNWIIQWSGEYSASGVMMYYKRENETESLFFPGPLKKPLTIMLLFQTTNPGIRWEYTMPHENATYTPEFNWKSSDWSVCTRTCGGGTQWSKAQCMEKEAGLVEDRYCENKTRPDDEIRSCNTHACPAWWWSGPWQPCSVTCGERVTRRRTVICVRSYGPTEQMALLDSQCSMRQKPNEEEQCPDISPCRSDSSWTVGPWTENCRGDPCEFEKRAVVCNAAIDVCDALSKPPDRRQCSNITCGYWRVGEWGQCSATCGEGFQIRNVECIDGIACTKREEPGSVKECKSIGCAPLKIQETLAEIYNEIEPILSDQQTPNKNGNTTDSNLIVPRTHLDDSPKANQTNWESKEGRQRVDSGDINNESIYKTNFDIPIKIENEPAILENQTAKRGETDRTKYTEMNNVDVNSLQGNLTKENDLPSILNLTADGQTKKKLKDQKPREQPEDAPPATNKEELDPNERSVPKENTRDATNLSIGDSTHDSPYYEATPDEYYDFEEDNDVNNRTLYGEKVQTIAPETTSTQTSQSDPTTATNSQNLSNLTTTETDLRTGLEKSDENSNSVENQKRNKGKETIKVTNVESDVDIGISRDDEKKDESVIYNYDQYSYDEYHNFDNVLKDVNDSAVRTNSTDYPKRPEGFVEDKVDIEDVQVIEIKLKKNKKFKKHNKGKKEKIKKIKIHTGVDAIRVLNKFTKKANAKKTAPPPPKSDNQGGDSLGPIFKWTIGAWSECSEPCGGGSHHRSIECQNTSSGAVVPRWNCHALPPLDIQSCNKYRCLNWTLTSFDPCSVTCGSGLRSRNATCPKEGRCHNRDLPKLQEECVGPPCVRWVKGPWSMCTKSCGSGYQIRFVKCVDVDTQEASQECQEERPPHKRPCNDHQCQTTRKSYQSHCKDLLDTKLCRRLVHMCTTKFVRIKCCRTCHRDQKQ